jgi:putative acetyltransferase
VITIRPEGAADRQAILDVNREAFGREDEARLVDALRESPAFVPALSLVAEEGGAIVGHILFTHLTVADGGVARPALALAPMAVLPASQNRGVGSALVRRGLADAREQGHHVVIVLGHPAYYPRFGFVPARPLGVRPPFDVPDDAFLVVGLTDGALDGLAGDVRHPPELADAR